MASGIHKRFGEIETTPHLEPPLVNESYRVKMVACVHGITS